MINPELLKANDMSLPTYGDHNFVQVRDTQTRPIRIFVFYLNMALGHLRVISSHGGSSVSLMQVMLEEKQDILNGSYSDYERDKTLPKKVPEFYYHTDVKINFAQKRWYWNSTKEAVKETSWDNVDYFQSDFPWMQDAVALDIYSDKVLFHVFVSFRSI